MGTPYWANATDEEAKSECNAIIAEIERRTRVPEAVDTAMNDLLHRPLGVVPDSAMPFYSNGRLSVSNYKRPANEVSNA